VRMLSNLGGFPALILVALMNVALLLLGTRYLRQVTAGPTGSTSKDR